MTMNDNEIIFISIETLTHVHVLYTGIHIYMTNNGNMEKSRSHGLIYLTFPILFPIDFKVRLSYCGLRSGELLNSVMLVYM